MSFEIPGFSFTREAAVDLSTKQHYFIVLDGNGRADLPGADGAVCAGVLQNDPLQFQGASLMADGVSKVVSNGTVEVGDNVACANGGKAKEAASGEYVQGVALEGDAASDGAVIAVLLRPAGRLA